MAVSASGTVRDLVAFRHPPADLGQLLSGMDPFITSGGRLVQRGNFYTGTADDTVPGTAPRQMLGEIEKFARSTRCWWPPKSTLTEVRRASGRPLWMNITHLCIAQISFLKVFTFD
jgi:hypothetical protein